MIKIMNGTRTKAVVRVERNSKFDEQNSPIFDYLFPRVTNLALIN